MGGGSRISKWAQVRLAQVAMGKTTSSLWRTLCIDYFIIINENGEKSGDATKTPWCISGT